VSSTTQQTGSPGRAEQATTQLGDAASSVQEKAGELKEQSRSKLSETLDERTTQVGGQAQQVAAALRHTVSEMRTQSDSANTQVTGRVEAAADRVEDLGGYLHRTSGDRLLHDVEDFARRRPWAVAGIGLAAGLAASRFLKASSERRYDSRSSGYPSSYMYGSGGGNGRGAGPYEPNGHGAGMEAM
jgi:ElaB/YqjD/DUF883 family membrane-anchored ribosome-binding protein